jgi:hypothetical protein
MMSYMAVRIGNSTSGFPSDVQKKKKLVWETHATCGQSILLNKKNRLPFHAGLTSFENLGNNIHTTESSSILSLKKWQDLVDAFKSHCDNTLNRPEIRNGRPRLKLGIKFLSFYLFNLLQNYDPRVGHYFL